ncbi:hypothetical protein ACR71G_17110 [Xenorhabdus bovienii]|uniref:hypothetical protein n=1 Tax=Xenorhabdus bovienii TaxID=40576 RepID=UPI003DA3D8B7
MDYKIIPFDYCSLDRAAKLFKCEIDDFFHWWQTGRIELCVHFIQMDHITLLSKHNKRIEFLNGRQAYEESQSGEYDLKNEEYVGFATDNTRKNDSLGIWELIGEAWGLWKPAPVAIENIMNNIPVTPGFWVQAYGIEDDMRLFIKNEIVLCKESLVIPKNELEKINLILNGQYDDSDKYDTQELLLLLSSVLKVVTSSQARKWSQGDIASAVGDKKIKGLGERKTNEIFSVANKLYNSIN